MRQFTLGEVLTLIHGKSYSKKDPCAKELIAYLSGEPASEMAWLGDAKRPTLCGEFLSENFPSFAAHTHEEIMEMYKQGLLDESLVNVPKYENFPQPD